MLPAWSKRAICCIQHFENVPIFRGKIADFKNWANVVPTNFWPLNVAKVGNTAKQKASTVAARFYVSFLLAKLAGRQITHLRPFGVS